MRSRWRITSKIKLLIFYCFRMVVALTPDFKFKNVFYIDSILAQSFTSLMVSMLATALLPTLSLSTSLE
jgi:hypothetical protein